MRGDLTLAILERLKDVAQTSAELIEVLLTSPYGTSVKGFKYRFRQIEKGNSRRALLLKDTPESRQTFSTMLYVLKKQGFIAEDKKTLKITLSGRNKLKKIIERRASPLPPTSVYPIEKVNVWTIVAFDIPEKERRKRRWISAALMRLKFKRVQQSLWMGKTKIPIDFLNDVRDLNLVSCLEIFEITKTGSLEHIL